MFLQKCILNDTDTYSYAMNSPKIVIPSVFSRFSWRWSALVVLLCSIFVLTFGPKSSDLHQDSDTHVMVQTIRERHAPMSWFVGDWPLKNHFYRPISALSFEWDNWRYGDDGSGYRWTNSIIAALTVLAVTFLALQLGFSSVGVATCALVWAAWLTGVAGRLFWTPFWFELVLAALVGLSVWLRTKQRSTTAFGVAAGLFAASELAGIQWLPGRILEWIPGRTASLCTLFMVIALALGVGVQRGKLSTAWLGAAFVAGWLALGAYEQAIVWLPVLLVLTWKPTCWRPLAVAGLGTGVYLAARTAFVEFARSAYQQQQFRSSGFSVIEMCAYVFPIYLDINAAMLRMGMGPYCLLDSYFWNAVINIAGFVGGCWWIWQSRRRELLVRLFIASAVAFAPMAMLKPFEHYHVLPMAIRSLFVACVLLDLLFPTALMDSRPTGQNSC